MKDSNHIRILLLPHYPERALKYVLGKLSNSRAFYLKNLQNWGGCILAESSSPALAAQSLRRVSGFKIIAAGYLLKGYQNLVARLKEEIPRIITYQRRFTIKMLKHSPREVVEDEDETMHLTGLMLDLMKGKKGLLRGKGASYTLNILTMNDEYFIPKISYEGVGGLPAGIHGSAICLISGGLGSIAAAIEVAKAGFRPVPLLVADFVDEVSFRRAIISSCLLKEMTLEDKLEMIIVVSKEKVSENETLKMHSMILKLAEGEAEKEGIEYICSGIHLSADLPALLDLYSKSRLKVINPVATWDRERMLNNIPEELARRFTLEAKGSKQFLKLQERGKVVRLQLQDLAHYNDVLDAAIRSISYS